MITHAAECHHYVNDAHACVRKSAKEKATYAHRRALGKRWIRAELTVTEGMRTFALDEARKSLVRIQYYILLHWEGRALPSVCLLRSPQLVLPGTELWRKAARQELWHGAQFLMSADRVPTGTPPP